jgi:2-polyprenyl-6-methoxyphenol hydroxylase-like FAD-dependent oxidoreductase
VADGTLVLTDGRTLKADLVIGADGTGSRLRDGLGLLARRKYLVDGCTRLLIPKTAEEIGRHGDGATTAEYWSGSRRVLYTPCSETEVYIALTMLDSDDVAKAVPVDRQAWTRWFPHLAALIARLGDGRYDRFEYTRLKRWSAGKVAIIGDAAHALPPNIGQGGGCAMMNALSMAVYLDRERDVPEALAAWEKNERAITEHTQRVSLMLGWPTTWPPFLRAKALELAGKSKWVVKQRTRTALHKPTGT